VRYRYTSAASFWLKKWNTGILPLKGSGGLPITISDAAVDPTTIAAQQGTPNFTIYVTPSPNTFTQKGT
jgi:hypothetical protein